MNITKLKKSQFEKAVCSIIPTNDILENEKLWMSGAALGITDKMEAWPQPPLLIPQARSQDEGVRSCDSDSLFPFFS